MVSLNPPQLYVIKLILNTRGYLSVQDAVCDSLICIDTKGFNPILTTFNNICCFNSRIFDKLLAVTFISKKRPLLLKIIVVPVLYSVR